MYLREMGSVELLSREGEIAIAKRIEAGRETMIAGLCESPLTFQAIIIWRDELNEAKILLREIIDLEATYAGPEAKQAPVCRAHRRARAEPPKPADAHDAPAGDDDDDDITRCRRRRSQVEEDEEDEDEAEPVAGGDGSRAEAAGDGDLRHHRRHLQEAPQAAGPAGREPADDGRHAVAQPGAPLQEAQGRDDQGGEVAVAQQSRIEALVEQLYDINKRLVQNEGRLLRLAESYGVRREEFLQGISGLRARPRTG